MRDLSKRCNKSLIKDYLANPDQTLEELSNKHGYKNKYASSYQITKYLSLSQKDRKLALK